MKTTKHILAAALLLSATAANAQYTNSGYFTEGYNYRHPMGEKNDGLWPDSSVRRILKNEMYIGNMIQGRNTTVSYKIHQCRAVPKEDWIRVTGTHEAIIDPDTFRKAQNLLGRYIRKPPKRNQVHLLSGFVRGA